MRLNKGVKAMQWTGNNAEALLSFATSCGVWGDDFKINTKKKIVVVLSPKMGYDKYPVGTWFIGRPKSDFPMIEPMSNYVFTEIFKAMSQAEARRVLGGKK